MNFSFLWQQKSSAQQDLININRMQSLDLLIPGFAIVLSLTTIYMLFVTPPEEPFRLWLYGALTLVFALGVWFNKLDFKIRASALYIGLSIVGLDQLLFNGLISGSLLILAVIPLIVSIHLGVRLGLVSLLLTFLGLGGILFVWMGEVQPADVPLMPYFWLVIIVTFALVAIAGQLSLNRLVKQMELARNREHALNAALEHEAERFNNRVDTRTATIEISSQIGQKIASILNEEELIQEIVSLLQQFKSYLHVAVYLKDDFVDFNTLQLSADLDRHGDSLIPKGYRLPINSGIFGKVFEEKRAFWLTDLENSDYVIPGYPSPVASSEMAVPIKSGNDVWGIVDIRQDDQRPLDLDDAFLLESVADQISVGLRNARLFSHAKKQAQEQLVVNKIRKELQSADTISDAIKIASTMISNELQIDTKISIGVKN